MIKVLHLLASNKFSGAENVACTMIEKFSDKYEMAYCSPCGSIEDVLKTKKIKYYPIDKLSIKNLKSVIKSFQPNIIHAHDYTASVLVAFSGFKGKIISHLHNNAPFATKWNFKTILYNISISKYSKVIGVSDKVYAEAIFKKKLKSKYITIYNYVDREKIIEKSNQYKFDKKYNLVFIGRLTDQKMPLRFIEIVNKMAAHRNDIRAVMIGDGELKGECIKTINEYGLQNNIDMLGFVENPFPIIKNCNIGIMPSAWEGFGLTAIESLILNKPVLNSGVGGLGEIFKNNKELICKSVNEYVEKIEFFKHQKFNFDKIVERFIDKQRWLDSMVAIYEGD